MLSFFPQGVLDEILNLIESVSEDFPSYSYSNSNCDLDLSPIMLKHRLIQDVAISKICIKLYQHQSINESIGLLTTYL